MNVVVPAAKLVSNHLLGFTPPKMAAEIVLVRNSFQTAAMNVGRQALRKQLVSGIKGRSVSKFNPTNQQSREVGCKETFLSTLCFHRAKKRSVPTFRGSYMKPWRDCPSS